MSALTPLALTFADILRHLATSDADQTHAVVAKATGRDTSNTRRDMGKLAEAGLIVGMGGDPTRYILTNAGGRALDALDRAEGKGQPVTGLPTWPLDGFRRNPDQPRKHFPDEMIADRAESIVQVGGLLHPLVVDPADASGVRMIQDGECRWRAAQLLAQEGRLPEALQSGLPYTERAAGEAEMLKVALIANAQRSDLTPWEDAQGLKRLKDLLGLSARGVAMAIGRAKEGSERGVGDVQQKIRTATLASADDIALHEAGKITWEELRASAQEARKLSPHAALAMAELRAKVEEVGHDPDVEISNCWVLSDGQGARWASHRELVEAKLIEDRPALLYGVLSPLVRITEAGEAWLKKACPARANALAAGEDDETLEYLRASWGRMEGGPTNFDFDEGFTTPWLNARHLQAQLDRRRHGLPDKKPDQVDIEEAIAATQPAATEAAKISPDLLLIIAEGAERYHLNQGCHPHRARLVEMTTAYPTIVGKQLSKAGLGNIVQQPNGPGRITTWLEITPKGIEAVRGLDLNVLRKQAFVSDTQIAALKRTGNYATPWLTWPKPLAASAQQPAPGAETKVAPAALSAKQLLLLAELADFKWRFTDVDVLNPYVHGGGHGLAELGLIQFNKKAGALDDPALRVNVEITSAGQVALNHNNAGYLLTGTLVDTARQERLAQLRLAVVSVTKASLGQGQYVTPWLNTPETAEAVEARARSSAEAAQASPAAFDYAQEAKTLERVDAYVAQASHSVFDAPRLAQLLAALGATTPWHLDDDGDIVSFELDAVNWIGGAAGTAINKLIAHAVNMYTRDVADRSAPNPWPETSPEGESPTARLIRTARAATNLMVVHYETLARDPAATEVYRQLSDAINGVELEERARAKAMGSPPNRDPDLLLILRKGDLVQKYIGGATTFRLLERAETSGPRVSFRVQTIRNGKDYGTPVALALNEIAGLLREPDAAEDQPEPATLEAQTVETEDAERDAANEDEYRGWIADALARSHQADPEAAPGFALEAFDKQTGDIKFLAVAGTWRRADAAFDAADWAAENLANGQLIEPEKSQTEGEETHAA